MNEETRQSAPKAVTSVFPALVLLAVSVVLVVWSYQYSATARQFPTLIAAAMVVLTLIDLWSRTKLPGQRFIRDFWGTEFDRREMSHNPPLSDELNIIAWVIGLFAGMAVIGILPTLPLFCFLYAALRARHPLLTAAAVGAVIFVFVFIVFEWALDYELYRGLLFSEGGVSRW